MASARVCLRHVALRETERDRVTAAGEWRILTKGSAALHLSSFLYFRRRHPQSFTAHQLSYNNNNNNWLRRDAIKAPRAHPNQLLIKREWHKRHYGKNRSKQKNHMSVAPCALRVCVCGHRGGCVVNGITRNAGGIFIFLGDALDDDFPFFFWKFTTKFVVRLRINCIWMFRVCRHQATRKQTKCHFHRCAIGR